MKAEQKIKQIRKTVSKQTGLLFLFCVLLMILGRVFIWNDNVLMEKLYNDPALRKIEDLRINWDGKQMKISDIWIEKDILKVSLEPEEKGRYTLEIFDKEDHFALFERLYVGPFNTLYSIDTGNFTGDTAVVLGIMIFQIGMFIIFARYYKQLKGPLLYSYDAILSLGIAVFMLVSFPNFIYLFIMLNHMISQQIVKNQPIWPAKAAWHTILCLMMHPRPNGHPDKGVAWHPSVQRCIPPCADCQASPGLHTCHWS